MGIQGGSPQGQGYVDILAIGRGGMGEVTLAVTRGVSGFKRLQVIKRLRPSLTDNADFVAMFLQEARLAARLSHPNIVQTNEVGHDGTTYFIAMEYLEGRPLSSILKKNKRPSRASTTTEGESVAATSPPFTLQMHLRVIADMLEGLHYAHELTDESGKPLALVHRDISPVNVLVTYDGVTKVLDFGIAKAADADVQTRTGVIKGKVPYIAPEVFFSKTLDRRCDIYAVGVMLWEAATGTKLWQGLSDLEIVRRLGKKDVPTPSSAAPDVNPKLEAICMKAIALAPSERYQTARELQEDIENVLRELGGMTSRAVGRYCAEVFGEDRRRAKELTEQRLKKIEAQLAEESGHSPRSSTPSSSELISALGLSSSSSNALAGVTVTPKSSPNIPVSGPPSYGGPTLQAAKISPLGPVSLAPPISQQHPPSGHMPVSMPPSLRSSDSAVYAGGPAAHLAQPPARMSAGLVVAFVIVGLLAVSALAVVGITEIQRSRVTPVAPVAAAPIKRTQLTVQAAPADAHIFLDDAALPANPYVSELPMDGLSHRVRVDATGYIPQTHLVRFDQPSLVLSVTLVKLP